MSIITSRLLSRSAIRSLGRGIAAVYLHFPLTVIGKGALVAVLSGSTVSACHFVVIFAGFELALVLDSLVPTMFSHANILVLIFVHVLQLGFLLVSHTTKGLSWDILHLHTWRRASLSQVVNDGGCDLLEVLSAIGVLHVGGSHVQLEIRSIVLPLC